MIELTSPKDLAAWLFFNATSAMQETLQELSNWPSDTPHFKLLTYCKDLLDVHHPASTGSVDHALPHARTQAWQAHPEMNGTKDGLRLV